MLVFYSEAFMNNLGKILKVCYTECFLERWENYFMPEKDMYFSIIKNFVGLNLYNAVRTVLKILHIIFVSLETLILFHNLIIDLRMLLY